MKMLAKPVLCACLAAILVSASGFARSPLPPRDHKQQQKVEVLPVREIERRVSIPGATYLGFDFDPQSSVYTLKFLRNGSVIWVDVDGRDGKILRTTGT